MSRNRGNRHYSKVGVCRNSDGINWIDPVGDAGTREEAWKAFIKDLPLGESIILWVALTRPRSVYRKDGQMRRKLKYTALPKEVEERYIKNLERIAKKHGII